MIKYREARMNEIKEISRFTTETFGDYPFFKYAFKNLDSKEKYIKYMDKLHYVHMKANMYKYKCFVGTIDGKIVSAALLQNPNVKRVTIFDYIKAGGAQLLFPVGFKSLIKFFDLSEESHKPCEKYKTAWYVELLAVSKNHKGQGLGSDMLNNCLIPYIKSERGTQLALITNTEQNCKFYKKNGFELFDKMALEMNGKQVNNYCFIADL